MPVVRAIYPKVYPLELTEEQQRVLREILADLEACRRGGNLAKLRVFNPQWADTWMLGDYAELQGKVHMVKALLGEKNLVIDHT